MKRYRLQFKDQAKTDINKYKVFGETPAYRKLIKLLKEIISLYKDNIIQEWTNFFILKKKVKFERITKRI